MRARLIQFLRFCIMSAIIFSAFSVGAQPFFYENERETITAASPDGNQTVSVVLPRKAIQPAQVAVIVNSQDPQSAAVADYYRQTRNIPAENRIEVSFPPGRTSIDELEFSTLKAMVDAAIDALPDIQALVITWTEPWKVTGLSTGRGMSITSAFALGFSPDYYNDGSRVCEATTPTPYYNTDSVRPYSDFGLRPAMMLAGVDAPHVIELIDRAMSADQTFPTGYGYFIRTTDVNRSIPRIRSFIDTVDAFNRPDALIMNYIDNSTGSAASGNYLSNMPDILFYFTGLATVPDINTNSYVAGAVADHLTSFGGVLTGSNGQMSVLRWLEAGAAASYGTVIEPCNFPDKFPQTLNFVSSYFGGATALEAYWKAVRTPGEGVFVGDPLTRPYGTRVTLGDDGTMEILTTILQPGNTYFLLEATSIEGPFKIVQADIAVDRPGFTTLSQSVGNALYVLSEVRDISLYESPRATLQAGRTAEVVTDGWYFLDLPDDPISPPVLLAGIETFIDSDPAGLRIRNLNAGGAEVRIEEETSVDTERAHAAEEVAYITTQTGPIYDFLGTIIGEAGFVVTNQDIDEWHLLEFNQPYADPVVFMNMVTTNGGEQSHIRIRNAAAGSVEYQIEEWDYRDQTHITETIAYVVVETGFYHMQDGRRLEVGTVATNHEWASVTFAQIFDSAPATISQCQTYNGSQAVTTRMADVNAADFRVRLQEEEGNDPGDHMVESVGFIAVETDRLQ